MAVLPIIEQCDGQDALSCPYEICKIMNQILILTIFLNFVPTIHSRIGGISGTWRSLSSGTPNLNTTPVQRASKYIYNRFYSSRRKEAKLYNSAYVAIIHARYCT
jgi:hypothetical protein